LERSLRPQTKEGALKEGKDTRAAIFENNQVARTHLNVQGQAATAVQSTFKMDPEF
jgi:hypothetical protein